MAHLKGSRAKAPLGGRRALRAPQEGFGQPAPGLAGGGVGTGRICFLAGCVIFFLGTPPPQNGFWVFLLVFPESHQTKLWKPYKTGHTLGGQKADSWFFPICPKISGFRLSSIAMQDLVHSQYQQTWTCTDSFGKTAVLLVRPVHVFCFLPSASPCFYCCFIPP